MKRKIQEQLFLLHIGRIGPCKALDLARKLEITFLALVLILPDSTVRLRGTRCSHMVNKNCSFDFAPARSPWYWQNASRNAPRDTWGCTIGPCDRMVPCFMLLSFLL
ncbi:hypothetical protein PIB30_050682 [Stylosanthes scabra]|uniref:Uncharacterized protein n=1 Tax=Stylosanthes scabra TaxID=79078 RepID=A0ABU6QHW8_9FABA|nr:hypothetical protein [Stylosanthes scabra]